MLDAKGGGKEDFAQAGGGDPKKIDLALTEANNFLNWKILEWFQI